MSANRYGLPPQEAPDIETTYPFVVGTNGQAQFGPVFCIPGFVQVFVKGLRQTYGVHFTATTTEITLDAAVAAPLLVGDHVDVVVKVPRSLLGVFRSPPVIANDAVFSFLASNDFVCTPTVAFELTFTDLQAGQSGNVYLDNAGGHAGTVGLAVLTQAGFLASISAAGAYWLEYNSPDGNVVLLKHSGPFA